ncbi:hypothetical protein [Mesobacterium pallidum]|uniref:hypothetical protein n=1 Tax=Mesobacterium pallidum TaxID=2872037 RepID=UPI001EE27F8E|nr:hypothetical protein [Mesobacterium pallidum]
MTETTTETRPTPLGIYDSQRPAQVTIIEVAALGLSAVWLLGASVVLLSLDDSAEQALASISFLMKAMTIFLPVAMIWVAAMAARSSRIMREESARLQTAVDALRQAYISQAQRGSSKADTTIARKLDEIAAAQKKTETALATFSTTREIRTPVPGVAPAPVAQPADQASLALGTPAEVMAPPLEVGDVIRALNFPETVDDEAGFSALRRALKDRQVSQLVQSAQDVLTLLSQEGIYMDDLRPDYARPEIWRRFAAGERGRTIAALGGIRDRSSLALTSARMKQDMIFRDAVHHFLRLFDKGFVSLEARASDSDIQAFAETRTARAFMLLGRVAGTFD